MHKKTLLSGKMVDGRLIGWFEHGQYCDSNIGNDIHIGATYTSNHIKKIFEN